MGGSDTGTCRGIAERSASTLAQYGCGKKGPRTDALISAELFKPGTVGAEMLPYFMEQLTERLDGDGQPGNDPLLKENQHYALLPNVGLGGHTRWLEDTDGNRVSGHPGQTTRRPVPGQDMRGHSFKFDPVLIECATADDLVANSAWVEKTSLVSGKWRPDAAGQVAPYPIHVRTQRMVRVDEGAGCCTEKSEDAMQELLGITVAKQMCDLFYQQFPMEKGRQVERLEGGELGAGTLRQNDWHRELTRLWAVRPRFEGWAVGGLDPKIREYPSTKSFSTAAWPVGLTVDLVVTLADAKKRVAWKESGQPWKAEWPRPRRLTE